MDRLTLIAWMIVVVLIVTVMTFGEVMTGPDEGMNGWTVKVQSPICQEDEVIVGTGDFDGIRWDGYRCQARDDL